MRFGSLCSGIGGLDLAVEATWDAPPAWFCEADPHAAKVLARHWPGVPILPDLKTQDWSQVEPVELVCAGYPCQPFSFAGRRNGADDPRHLWPFVAAAVRVLRPRLVVLENVAGHLGLGFDAVLADLATLGFDAEWATVRASDAGACHRRERLFVVARHPERERANTCTAAGGSRNPVGESDRDVADTEGGAWSERDGDDVRAGCGSERRRPTAGRSAVADTRGERLGQHTGEPPTQEAGTHEGDQPRCDGSRWPAPDTNGGGCEVRSGRQHARSELRPGVDERCAVVVADADLARPQGCEPAGRHVMPAWGDYGPAITRWEHVIGRHAPEPTDERGRLSVAFVEWMMGFDAGWVDGLTRTAALRCLGNAVVQQQAILALAGMS